MARILAILCLIGVCLLGAAKRGTFDLPHASFPLMSAAGESSTAGPVALPSLQAAAPLQETALPTPPPPVPLANHFAKLCIDECLSGEVRATTASHQTWRDNAHGPVAPFATCRSVRLQV